MQKPSQKNKLVILLFVILISCFLHVFYSEGEFLHLSSPLDQAIFFEIRLPRVIMCLLSGVILSFTGLLFQTILNNMLADSYSLGLASGASLGAGLGVVLGVSYIAIALLSISMSILSLVLILLLASIFRNRQVALILFGMFLNMFFASVLYVLLLLNPNKQQQMLNYLFGSLSSVDLMDVILVGCVTLIGIIIIGYHYHSLSLMRLGELTSKSLGMSYTKLMYLLLLVASIMTAVLISVTGIIGFVGLVIPAMMKHVKGRFYDQTILTVLFGMLVLVLGDFIGKNIVYPIEIPVSIMMSIIGCPMLFYLLIRELKYTR
ncbi:iron ABC transporter permease [Macrococcus sp. DPC7161]|uniref:FecCD family ABC transporter permease n=1 Tax=Macrococcus sp. DPC7161 TaxID=2507060 RepID=UPI00100A54B8|nr:iron ABC transporter permease [Macrococcus sp. DPC7161]RXK17652.1 iron ABC transporter permease [Macrococcus sp. DPC7161]